MFCREKLFHLFDGLNEHDQKTAYEFIQSLVIRNGDNKDERKEVNILGREYFVIRD